MRAPSLSWPKASGLPLLVCAAAIVNPFPAIGAGDAPGSVTFVDREALGANSWAGSSGNPLRGPGDASQSQFGSNSLRNSAMPSDDDASMASGSVDAASRPANEVVPASYTPRDPNGLQLRPYTPPTGIFSGSNPEPRPATNYQPNSYQPKLKSKAPNQSAPTQANNAAQANAARAAAAQAAPNQANTTRSQGLMPQFLSIVPKPKSKPASPTYGAQSGAAGLAASMSPAARTGSATSTSPYSAATRPQSQSAGSNTAAASQAAYASANAAAQSYRHAGMTAATSSPAGRATATRQPASAASYGPTLASPNSTNSNPAASRQPSSDNSPAAQMLVEAHARGDSAQTEEEFSQVYAACQRVMASQPTATEAGFAKQLAAWSLNRRGQIKASAGQSADALADFSAAIQLDPKLWRAIHNRGVLMAQAGQFEKAFDDFNRTTDLNPQFAKAFSNRAALYVVAGQMEPALSDYRRACELDPTLVVAQRGYGRVCHMLGRLGPATQHLNKAVELAPNDASALTSRGDLFTDLGNYAEAAADYDRALKLDSKSAEACRGSAWLLATCPDNNVRNPDVAIHRAELAVKLDRKQDATTYDTLAAAQASAGDFAAATETIRRAIELAPPSEKSVFQDRLALYRQSTPFRISPLPNVQQAQYQQQ